MVMIDFSNPDALAVQAPQRPDLSFGELQQQIDYVGATLNQVGLGRGSRVAMYLKGGPDAATAFVAISSFASSVPLEPTEKAENVRTSLMDLDVKAVIIDDTTDPVVAHVATELDLPVILMHVEKSYPAGKFLLDTSTMATGLPTAGGRNTNASEALVIRTSGTTGKQKIVALTLSNLDSSAFNIRNTYALSPADKGLVLMNMFHIHGLIAGVLAPLSAGGSIYCPDKFSARSFFGWMSDAKPTWFTAVPTMHQFIVDTAAKFSRYGAILAQHKGNLRFVRSCSSSLSPTLYAEMEKAFGVPVVEALGMSEATHQVCSNPIGASKAGTVGKPTGVELQILDADHQPVPQGQEGLIAIRGMNVITGYFDNTEANAKDFLPGGWFLTGDLGALDEDGYLSVRGRQKEIIKRAGENINPVQIDHEMVTHPEIAEAISFGIPDQEYGEIVGAIIVLREDSTLDEDSIRQFLLKDTNLERSWVPTQFFFREAIPKNATGKVSRNSLAKQLDLA